MRVQRRRNSPECDVIAAYRGREMSLQYRDHDQAIKWARIECKVYKLGDAIRRRAHRLETATALLAIKPVAIWPSLSFSEYRPDGNCTAQAGRMVS